MAFASNFLAGDASLQIEPLKPSDEGRYTCKVKNSGRYVWSHVILKVLGKIECQGKCLPFFVYISEPIYYRLAMFQIVELLLVLQVLQSSFFKQIFYLCIFRERGREGEREKHRCGRGTLTRYFSHARNWRPGPTT